MRTRCSRNFLVAVVVLPRHPIGTSPFVMIVRESDAVAGQVTWKGGGDLEGNDLFVQLNNN